VIGDRAPFFSLSSSSCQSSFRDILSSASLAWSLWQHVILYLSSGQCSFCVFRCYITGSIDLCFSFLVQIFLYVIELCWVSLFCHPWPVCSCVCLSVSPGTFQVWIASSCFIVLTLIPMFLHRNQLNYPHIIPHCMLHVSTVISIHIVEAKKLSKIQSGSNSWNIPEWTKLSDQLDPNQNIIWNLVDHYFDKLIKFKDGQLAKPKPIHHTTHSCWYTWRTQHWEIIPCRMHSKKRHRTQIHHCMRLFNWHHRQ
jgi:hypothetical protein